MGLDQQVVDLRRDRVGVLGHERREQVRVADRVEDALPGPVAAGQHEPERIAAGFRPDPMGVDDGAR